MYKISLVNMPFANPGIPSIALTQLKSIAEQQHAERVRVRILYLNLEFTPYLGRELQAKLTGALQTNNSGLGDWFFRQVAFPREPDNAGAYFARYFPHKSEQIDAVKGQVLAKRVGLERFMRRLVVKHRLADEDLVGFTSMFAQTGACFAMARLIKERNPNVVTVMGGANCEAPMGREIAIHLDAVDFVFSGPSLISFPRFVGHRIGGEAEACHGITGVFSGANCDSQHLSGPGAIGEELPLDVPVPLDYTPYLQDLERHFPNGEVRPSLPFETSRGCWWGERSHCTFCGLNGGSMKYRAMPSEMALDMIQGMIDQYKDRCSRFESVDNILPREYLKDVFPKLDAPQGITLFYEVKADLKEHEMALLARAGVKEIQPGIESLASSTLKLMGKGTTAFHNLVFLKNCLKYEVNPGWNLLIGFPGEDESVYEKYLSDLPLLYHLPPPSGAFPVRFDRYSPYFVNAEHYGLDLSPYDFYGFLYPFSESSLSNMAYYFEDRNYNAEYMVKMLPWQNKLSAAVARWHERWQASDGGVKASLCLQQHGGKTVVHDTRSGQAVHHELDETDLYVLGFREPRRWRIRDLAKALDVAEEAAAERVDRLRGLGLLFEENEAFLNLVTDDEQAKVEFKMQARAPLADSRGFDAEAGGIAAAAG